MNIPTTDLQDQSIAGIVHWLRKYHDEFDEPMSSCKAVHSLLLKHGRAWYIGKGTFTGRRASRKQCYMNAYALADNNQNLIYTEGWCWSRFYLAHAWCIDQDGQVIDPTLREATGYYGIPFKWDFVRATASRTKVYGIISESNIDLLESPAETFIHEIAYT